MLLNEIYCLIPKISNILDTITVLIGRTPFIPELFILFLASSILFLPSSYYKNEVSFNLLKNIFYWLAYFLFIGHLHVMIDVFFRKGNISEIFPLSMLAKSVILALAAFTIYTESYENSNNKNYKYKLPLQLYMVVASMLLVTYINEENTSLLIILILIECLSFLTVTFISTNSNIVSAVRYIIPSIFSFTMLSAGIALLYTSIGTLNISEISILILSRDISNSTSLIFGIVLIIFSLFIKLAISPFHSWSFDVYHGMNSSTLLFYLSVVKVSLFFTFLGLFKSFLYFVASSKISILLFFGIPITISFFISTFGLFTKDLRRFIAVTSLAQVSYSILSILTFHYIASFFYFITYIITTVTLLKMAEIYSITKVNEFNSINLLEKFILFVCVVNLAGIPPVGSFFIKVDIWNSLITFSNNFTGMSSYILIILWFISILASFPAIYYYLNLFFNSLVNNKNRNLNFLPTSVRLLAFISTVFIFLVYIEITIIFYN